MSEKVLKNQAKFKVENAINRVETAWKKTCEIEERGATRAK